MHGAIIACSSLFGGLPAEQLQEISALAQAKKYGKGVVIFEEGQPGAGFYLIASGQVKVLRMTPDGREHILHIFGPGEPFGEAAVFQGRSYPASAITLSEAELLFFPRADFVRLTEAHPTLALNMLGVLSGRLRAFATQIEHLVLKEVPARLAAYLLRLAESQNRSDRVRLDIPKGQLAALLGASPETLSRIFQKMTAEGLIQVKGRDIFLVDQMGLRKIT